MRVVFLTLMLAFLGAPQAVAQTPERFFGYSFGMSQAQARALTPNATWDETPVEMFSEEGRVGLRRGHPQVVADIGFVVGLEFAGGRLDRINLIAGGPVETADECNARLFSVVTALEETFGAFTGAPLNEELLQDFFVRTTVRGGQVRVYGHPDIGVLGYANTRSRYFIEARSMFQITPWRDGQLPPCMIVMLFEPTPPPETPRRQAPPAPDAAAFNAAERLETPVWAATADEDDFWSAYPRVAGIAGIGATVVLDCLVQDDSSVRCRVGSEDPEGAGFGEAARIVAEAYKIAPMENGAPATGRRVRLPITFTAPERY